MKTRTVTRYYSQDHQRLDDLFHRFQERKATDFQEACRLFAEFKAGLEHHILWEEEVLFPAFDAKIGERPGSPTGFMCWEHRHLRRYLARIEENLPRVDTETELVQIAFASLLGAHNRKEERMLYPVLDEMLAEPERHEIFLRMDPSRSGVAPAAL
ncbi:MAG: hemerythrin domain-containing protein [Verrucomicrobia bacterium]|nr:hemerythrin domain-containing protein [Verrucomicrobiota bacterium]